LVGGLNSEPATIATFGVGVIAELVGAILLAIPLVRHCSTSSWIGYVTSALMLVLEDFVIAPGGPATNVAVNLMSNLGPVLLMVAVGALGRQLWSAHVAVPQP